MKIRTSFKNFTIHCIDAWVWRPGRMDYPAWIAERFLAEHAHTSESGSIMIRDKNGYHVADHGDLIVLVTEDRIDIIHKGVRRD